jgi:hypothetical protein
MAIQHSESFTPFTPGGNWKSSQPAAVGITFVPEKFTPFSGVGAFFWIPQQFVSHPAR